MTKLKRRALPRTLSGNRTQNQSRLQSYAYAFALQLASILLIKLKHKSVLLKKSRIRNNTEGRKITAGNKCGYYETCEEENHLYANLISKFISICIELLQRSCYW